MARKQRERRKRLTESTSSARNNKSGLSTAAVPNRPSGRSYAARDRSGDIRVPLSSLSQRSFMAWESALHVKAAMVRDPKLSLSTAAKSEGVSPRSIRKYFSSGFKKVNGRWRANKFDRFHVTMFVPDASGNPVPVHTNNSQERAQVSAYLRDLGRYYRGNTSALAAWPGKSIAGVPLVTAARTLKSIESQLSDFAIYRAFNGGAE